jgi:hypothetical protein
MPLEKVRKVLKIAKEPLSPETPIGDEEDCTGDLIEDKNAVLPIDTAIQSNHRDTTRVLAGSPRARNACCAFRIGEFDHTLEEVGQQFIVTRERIRQIEAKALRKLKHPSRSRCGFSRSLMVCGSLRLRSRFKFWENGVHKFTVGQLVNFTSSGSQSVHPEIFVIIRLVVDDDADPRYRIKNNTENFERVVHESELALARTVDVAPRSASA